MRDRRTCERPEPVVLLQLRTDADNIGVVSLSAELAQTPVD